MKYIFKSLIIMGFAMWACSPRASAQKPEGLGISFGGNDFYGPQTGNVAE